MAKWHVYGKIEGSIYLGEVEAATRELAMEKAVENAYVGFCHHCSHMCEDPEVEATEAVEVE